MFDKDQFWNLILNGMDLTTFFAYCFFILIGALIHFATDVRDSVRLNKDRPKFNFWFMLRDNLMRGFLGAISIFICVIFHKELFGQDPSTFVMLLTGLSIDRVIGRTLKPLKEKIK